MLKAIVRFYDERQPLPVVIGTGEDVKAPRDLAVMQEQGWVVDDNTTTTYKAFLAAKRQGDVPADSKFEKWLDEVVEIEVRPSVKQIEQAVTLGSMEREQADKLIAALGLDEGEAEGLRS